MKEPLLKNTLEPPHYGFEKNNSFYRPSHSEIIQEFFSRLNIFSSSRNWIGIFELFVFLSLLTPFCVLIVSFFSAKWIAIAILYGVFLNVHGTVYLHRYGAHKAFEMRNTFFLFCLRNLSIKVFPEEIFTVSHIVHHLYPEQAGDPYNAHGGWLYCFLSDFNHQPINRTLDESDYLQVAKLVEHQGVIPNRYDQYLRFGSIANPLRTILSFILNWGFWFFAFYQIGGYGLVCATFGMTFLWSVSLRSFNYKSHGKGEDRQRSGIEFNRKDLSLNRWLPGMTAGEWHNHHHLYPASARAGFLPHQPDLSFYFIRLLHHLRVVTKYNDHQERFLREHYLPYQNSKKASS